jgi:1,4-alpha-glucan branching enzyme
VPIDRALMDLVWHTAATLGGGLPQHAHHTEYRHTPWAVDGAPYDPARGPSRSARTRATSPRRRRGGSRRRARGLRARHRAAGALLARGGRLAGGDDRGVRRGGRRARAARYAAGRGVDAAPAPRAARHELGEPRDLATWSAPPAAELAWLAREAELRVLATGPIPAPRALRELMALQASDWAFGVTRETAGPTRASGARPRRRARARARRSGRNRFPPCATLHLHSTCLTVNFRVS